VFWGQVLMKHKQAIFCLAQDYTDVDDFPDFVCRIKKD
jgi:hypothetical protein